MGSPSSISHRANERLACEIAARSFIALLEERYLLKADAIIGALFNRLKSIDTCKRRLYKERTSGGKRHQRSNGVISIPVGA